MKEHSGMIAGELFYRSWVPDAPKAAVLLVHGLAEHVGRYEYVSQKLTDANYAVFAIDHVGHGQSAGTRCYVHSFDDYLDGVDALYMHMRKDHVDLPVVILGHSMGGLIAASSVLRDPERYRALVLSGPAIVPPAEPPWLQKFIVRLLSKYAPKQGVLQLDASAISRDQSVVDAYNHDALVFSGKVTARLASELFDAMGLLQDRAGDLTLPLLLMHGSQDRLTAPAGSALLHDRATSTDKTLRMWDGLYHEIFNEPERDDVIGLMVVWLNARM
ncbi:MAG: lysophospholipase [Pseudomonadota bacterium]